MSDTSEEILELIRQEVDAKVKTQLLIQYRMSQALDANTDIVKKLATDLEGHREELNGHIKNKSEREGKIKGMRMILIPLLSFLQVAIVGVVGWVASQYTTYEDRMITIEKDVAVLMSRQPDHRMIQ